jgi:hypothetical protein
MKDTLKDGKCIQYYKNGKVGELSEWKMGKIDGKYEAFYENGNPKLRMRYIEGIANGEVNTFFENGYLMEVYQAVNGVIEGAYKRFDEKGLLVEVLNYRNGQAHGDAFYYENGRVKEKKEYLYIPKYGTSILNQYVRYDSKENPIIDDGACLYFVICQDTIRSIMPVEMKIEVNCGKYKHAKFIVGDFNEQYEINNTATLDTIEGKDNIITYTFNPKQKGKLSIRGVIYSYKDSLVKGINMGSGQQIFFHKDLFVK